jgi:uncharacterized protein YecE (DUF72 family)
VKSSIKNKKPNAVDSDEELDAWKSNINKNEIKHIFIYINNTC